MKIYVSADIEGIAGISSWDEATIGKHGYEETRERMTAHVGAACEGAVAGGATEIVVKDAHGSGRNIRAERLPRCARVIRGWAPDPLMMVQGLDGTFDALFFVGYHAAAGSAANPDAHTMSHSRIALLSIDGRPVSEMHLYGWAAGLFHVPLALVSGDGEVCRAAAALDPAIRTVPVLEGSGASTISLHPDEAADAIRRAAEEALVGGVRASPLAPPASPVLTVSFREPGQASKAGHYPGAERTGALTVRFAAPDYHEVLRAVLFLSGV